MSQQKPYERIKELNRVQNEVRQMQDNLRKLQSELRQLEWKLLGGRSMYDPAEAHKLCIVTSECLELLADDINDLPRNVEELREQQGIESDEGGHEHR